jgi:hypothetical protein
MLVNVDRLTFTTSSVPSPSYKAVKDESAGSNFLELSCADDSLVGDDMPPDLGKAQGAP